MLVKEYRTQITIGKDWFVFSVLEYNHGFSFLGTLVVLLLWYGACGVLGLGKKVIGL